MTSPRNISETGAILRTARTRSGLTQRALSRRAGIDPSVLSAYENGQREPSARTFRRLLTAAGTELSLTDRWDSRRNGQIFEAVMEMTDHLPQRARGALECRPFRGLTGA